MKISEIYHLGKSQFELDFVDIDPNNDLLLFVDPQFISHRQDEWSYQASVRVKSFFQKIITLLRSGNRDEAKELFLPLREPNETCLGMSKEMPVGRGAGSTDAEKIFDSIARSRAITTGLVEDLE